MVARLLNKALPLALILLSAHVFASSQEFRCHSGQMDMPAQCRQMPGLAEYLKSDGPPSFAWQNQDVTLLRDCLKGVRQSYLKALYSSAEICKAANDQAFGLLMKIGQSDIVARGQKGSGESEVDRIRFEDQKCFGSVCHFGNYYVQPYRPASTGNAVAGQ